MQVLVYIALLVVGLSFNFIWDVLVRSRKARELGGQRREARPRALPPAPDDDELARRLPDAGLRGFIGLTRETFAELDRLIDHFDLLLLRARDRARYGLVSVKAELPRQTAVALLERWLGAWSEVDEDTREELGQVALGPGKVAEVLHRERERMRFEFGQDTAPVLDETIRNLDLAVIHMQGIVALLEARDDDPYR